MRGKIVGGKTRPSGTSEKILVELLAGVNMSICTWKGNRGLLAREAPASCSVIHRWVAGVHGGAEEEN